MYKRQPLDRWQNDEKKDTLNTQQIRGRELFFSKAKCNECHFTGDFTADEFRGIGLFDGKKHNDSGRYVITKNKSDIGKFKVPGLRNIALTAPYMHDGSMKTLREVIDYYDNPGKMLPNGLNRDSAVSYTHLFSIFRFANLPNCLIIFASLCHTYLYNKAPATSHPQ